MKVFLRKDARYSALVTMGWMEGWVSDDTIKQKLEEAGFTEVEVTGSGGERQAKGQWTGDTGYQELEGHLSNVQQYAP